MMLSLTARLGRHAAWVGGAAALAGAASFPLGQAHLSAAPSSEPLSPDEWRSLKVLAREGLTQGERPTILLRFGLPPNHPPLPVASCLLVRAPVGKVKDDGSRAFVLRPYTPVSAPDADTLDLALKIYPGGALTPYLGGLKPGDVLEFKGPLPKLPIAVAREKSAIGMVAGGTGITPMLQLAEELLRTGYSGKISLIYANVSPAEIMLKDVVDALAAKHQNFSVYYLVDKAAEKENWKGGVGYVTPDMLKAHLPAASAKDSLVLVCGPPGMMKVVSGEKVSPKDQGPVAGMLASLHYTAEQVVKF